LFDDFHLNSKASILAILYPSTTDIPQFDGSDFTCFLCGRLLPKFHEDPSPPASQFDQRHFEA
jgi:hypothetical protein